MEVSEEGGCQQRGGSWNIYVAVCHSSDLESSPVMGSNMEKSACGYGDSVPSFYCF